MKELFQFEHMVDGLYGHYLDSLSGFRLLREAAIKEKESLSRLLSGENSTEEEMAASGRQCKHSYSNGSPESLDFVELHSCSYDQYIERNSPSGMNPWFAGTTFVINVYAFWEHFHRARIAARLGCHCEDLKAPIMGDLRHYRNSIVHNKGKAAVEIEKCEILKWYKAGDVLNLDDTKIAEIVAAVKRWIRELKKQIESPLTEQNGR